MFFENVRFSHKRGNSVAEGATDPSMTYWNIWFAQCGCIGCLYSL